jgi:hypothetical protein
LWNMHAAKVLVRESTDCQPEYERPSIMFGSPRHLD